MENVISFLSEHGLDLLRGLVEFALVVAVVTPTDKDDKVVGRIANLLGKAKKE